MTASLLPKRILARIVDRATFDADLEVLSEMTIGELYASTHVHLKNLDRLVADDGPDFDLRAVLVPEIWDRLRPGCRAELRRITTSLAEYQATTTTSLLRRMLSDEKRAELVRKATALREQIETTGRLDRAALVERVRFAISGSTAGARFAPSAFVYEPAFTYRLAPELAKRCP